METADSNRLWWAWLPQTPKATTSPEELGWEPRCARGLQECKPLSHRGIGASPTWTPQTLYWLQQTLGMKYWLRCRHWQRSLPSCCAWAVLCAVLRMHKTYPPWEVDLHQFSSQQASTWTSDNSAGDKAARWALHWKTAAPIGKDPLCIHIHLEVKAWSSLSVGSSRSLIEN